MRVAAGWEIYQSQIHLEACLPGNPVHSTKERKIFVSADARSIPWKHDAPNHQSSFMHHLFVRYKKQAPEAEIIDIPICDTSMFCFLFFILIDPSYTHNINLARTTLPIHARRVPHTIYINIPINNEPQKQIPKSETLNVCVCV